MNAAPQALGQGDARPGTVPPHDLDAEAAILSCLILEPSKLDEAGKLSAFHFYSPANRLVFETILALDQARAAIDTVTIAGWLKDRQKLKFIGGVPYLARIVDAAPAVANMGWYVDTVREKWRIRAMISACQKGAAEGYGDVGDAQAWIQSVEQAVFDLAHENETSDLVSIKDSLQCVLRRSEEAARRGNAILGTSTGFAGFDELISGLHEGELCILAARPGMGKTSFALNLAVNIAAPKQRAAGQPDEPGKAVVVFTLEMPRDQISMRMLCSEAYVDVGKMRRNRLTPEDWENLTKAASFLAQLPIHIDDTAAITLLELRAKVRRHARELANSGQKLGLVVVDYLQLMSSPAHAKNREQEVAVISKGLKQLSKEMKVPVLALSQMNRSVESRAGGKRPQLSDLRESGAIEQDADLVVFLHRDEYYDKDSALAGYAEALVEKQRNGPTGSVWLRWSGGSTRFDEPDHEELVKIDEAIARKAAAAGKKGGWVS